MDVFISYSHHDESYAKDIAERLEKNGISYFLDKKIDVGECFESEIRNHLRLCKEVFSLISPKSLTSEWVFVECGAAWALGKHISPILLGCRFESLPSILKARQAKSFEQIEDIIDDCKKRVSTEPNLRGKWKYKFYGFDGLPKYVGTCEIDEQREEYVHFSGTRTLEVFENKKRRKVKKNWYSGWAAICPDGKIRAEYKLGNNNNGFMSLLIPPDRPVQKIYGEVYFLATQAFGNIEFIRT